MAKGADKVRTIDADELKQAEKRISSLPWGDGRGNKVKFTWMPHEVQRLIDNSPTIDAVEVVRCRDCKNRAKYAVCDFLGEDGFCSHGEHREDGEA